MFVNQYYLYTIFAYLLWYIFLFEQLCGKYQKCGFLCRNLHDKLYGVKKCLGSWRKTHGMITGSRCSLFVHGGGFKSVFFIKFSQEFFFRFFDLRLFVVFGLLFQQIHFLVQLSFEFFTQIELLFFFLSRQRPFDVSVSLAFDCTRFYIGIVVAFLLLRVRLSRQASGTTAIGVFAFPPFVAHFALTLILKVLVN